MREAAGDILIFFGAIFDRKIWTILMQSIAVQ